MTRITDEFMRQMISGIKSYSLVILKAKPNRNISWVEKINWEHGRRTFALRVDGELSIVCPISDDSHVRGIRIFDASIDEVKSIMDEDTRVKEGVFIYFFRASQRISTTNAFFSVYLCRHNDLSKLPLAADSLIRRGDLYTFFHSSKLELFYYS